MQKKSRVQKNFHNQNPHDQKLFTTKKHVPKKGQCPTTHTQTKKQKKKKKQCPTKNFTTIKIFHMDIYNYQIFFP